MQIGYDSNALWAGTLRVKDGHVPVIYQGNPDDGADDSIIYWQGDLSKPYLDDERDEDGKVVSADWKSGWAKAYNTAEAVINTFLRDGIEAAAKKVISAAKP